MKKIIVCSILMIFLCSIFTSSNATTINNSKWDLHFENIKITEGSVNATLEPTITKNSNTEITYSVNLNTPGDFYEFTVDVVNNGSLDAMVNEVSGTELTVKQKKYLDYEVTYIDGTEVKQNDLLRAGTTEKLRIRLEFKRDITSDDLPKEDTPLTLLLNTYYVQADSNSVDNNTYNENGSGDNEENGESQEKSIWDFIKNPKTGDVIIAYAFIFILALVALLITKKKSDKEDEI